MSKTSKLPSLTESAFCWGKTGNGQANIPLSGITTRKEVMTKKGKEVDITWARPIRKGLHFH